MLIGGRLGGSDIHVTIDLHGICADDFTAKLFGKLDAKSSALAIPVTGMVCSAINGSSDFKVIVVC